MVFVIPELLAAQAAAPRRCVLVHVALEAAVGTQTVPADRAAERAVFTGHGFPPAAAVRVRCQRCRFRSNPHIPSQITPPMEISVILSRRSGG